VIRISAGTAACMGLKGIKMTIPPTTAYLLWGERCLMGCSFCPQSHKNSAVSRFLGRVNWPSFTLPQLASGLAGAKEAGLQRVCLQGVRGQEGAAPLLAMLQHIKGQTSLPICISAWIDSISEADALLAAGADRISIALDAVTPEVYRQVKGGSFEERKELLLTCARRWPGRIATHIIVGLKETEEEALRLMDRLYREQVTVALFAFTPLKGTPLAGHPPPELSSYRRIQAASFLLQRGDVSMDGLRFQEGRLISFSLEEDKLRSFLKGGKAFETRGCPHCNRPFYNERPGSVLYNYPRPLSSAEEEAALSCLTAGGGRKTLCGKRGG
jgi:lipoyl synthase